MSKKKGPVERLSRLPLVKALANQSCHLLRFAQLRAILQDRAKSEEDRVKAIARELQLKLNRQRPCEHWRFHKWKGTRCSCLWHRTISIIWTALREEESRRYSQQQRDYVSLGADLSQKLAGGAAGQEGSAERSSPRHGFLQSSPIAATDSRRKRSRREHGIKIRPDETLLDLGFDEEV